MKNMKTIKSITFLFLVLCLPLFGQTYSLKQCIEYARKNNSNIKTASLDSDISGKMVTEQIGTGLPQIDITGSFDDKLKITTQILPGELIGKPGTFIPVQMGTKYNVSAGISLTQKIFDPSFWVGLKAAKISKTMSEQNIQKTDEQTMYDISSAYYKATIIKKQLDNMEKILAASGHTLKSTELKHQNGLVKKIVVDKIKVSYNATNSQVQQTELSYKQALNNLKFYMGMPVGNDIVLQAALPDSVTVVESGENINFVENRVDYQIQKTNIELYEADKENNISAYLPTLSFYANYNLQAMRTELDFFKSGRDWYNNSAIGLELKI